jgi:hypothetical protein
MTSYFAWLDYSEKDRRTMLDVVSAFGDQTTRDELGLGTVRDAFADLLFPGTSTIQTRARYFLFVPWIYKQIEAQKAARRAPRRAAGPVADMAREHELALVEALAASDDAEGTIGGRARGNLKRLPSSVYWQGLQRWGVLMHHGSISQYHQAVERAVTLHDDSIPDGDPERAARARPRFWHAGLPELPPDLLRGSSFRLTHHEADYLRERVMSTAPETMLAFLVSHSMSPSSISRPWLHPLCGELPASIRETLAHARNFSEVMHGAALLYNLLLAKKAGRDAWIDRYTGMFQDWSEEINRRREALLDWDRDQSFWEIIRATGANVSPSTIVFIREWLTLALETDTPDTLATDEKARSLVEKRERRLKGQLSRLKNRHALDLWNGDAGAGAAQYVYRWPTVQALLNDILQGLGEDDHEQVSHAHGAGF